MTNPIDYTFDNRAAMTEAATAWIAERLETSLQENGEATFFGSGGSTPGPVYSALSLTALTWDKISVGLVDDRWVPPTSDASNEKLLRDLLLVNKAENAPFTPMVTDAARDPFGEVADIAATYDALCETPDVVILGMGPDAHVLSWFAGARGLDAALDTGTTSPVAAVEAVKTEVTGNNLLRMTLTRPVLERARFPIMLIAGDTKKDVYENASPETPVGRLIEATGDRMAVFWSP